MRNKITISVIIICMTIAALFCIVSAREVQAKTDDSIFSDLSRSSGYYVPAKWAVEEGVINIDGDEFEVSTESTRGGFLLALWRAVGSPKASISESGFADAPSGGVKLKSVLWAQEFGIVDPADGLLQLKEKILKREAAAYIWRLAGCPDAAKGTAQFDDLAKSDPDYKAVLWVKGAGIFKSKDGAFNPDIVLTRGQTVLSLYRLRNLLDKSSFSKASVKLSKKVFYYSGKEKKPSVTVKLNNFNVKQGRDYVVTYANDIEPGTATVTVKGTGLFSGSISKNYKIKLKYAPTLKSVTNKADGIVVKWKKLKGADFYRVYRSEDNGKSWKGIAWCDTTSYTDGSAAAGKTYRYTVRAYTNNGVKSPYDKKGLKIKRLIKEGLYKVENQWWLVKSNGKINTGYSGFYTDKDGTWEIKNGLLVGQITGTRLTMYQRAQGKESETDYLIIVDTSANYLGIYKGYKGNWKEIKYYRVSTGAYNMPTVTGTFKILNKAYYFDSENVRCFYACRFYGAYWLHSVLYAQTSSPQTILDGRIGMDLSHGCVRQTLSDAKWIYDNVPIGTTVYVYNK